MTRLVRQLTIGVLAGLVPVGVLVSPVAAASEPSPVRAIVKAEPGASFDGIAAAADAVVTKALIPSRGVFEVAWPDAEHAKDAAKDAKKLAKELERDDRVVWGEPDVARVARDDRFHAWPLGMPAAAEPLELTSQPAFGSLDLSTAHTMATGRDVVVAVLDTGVDAGHPMLAGAVLPGYDLVDDDDDPSESADGVDDDSSGIADDSYGHGTFVAGVVRQIAPGAQILPVRVLDEEGRGEFYTIAEGIELAVEAGADVINLSLGVGDKDHGKLIKEALKRARKADVIVVAAAGNTGSENRYFPAADHDVVGVTALDHAGASLASFAGRGKWVDVAAPGVGIVSAMAGGGVVRWNGTSMATPVVSAQLALMIDARPDDDVKHLEKRLWKSCRKFEHKGLAERGSIDLVDSLR